MNNPIARNSDPSTSHEAAAKLTDSGKRMTLAEKAALLVEMYPNSTYVELWQKAARLDEVDMQSKDFKCTFVSPESLMKRLNDARAKGWIESGEQRLCPVTGNKQLTWHVKGGRR